jgi:hypothetical protein
LRLIEASFDAKPFVRGNEITIEGPDAARVGTLINEPVLLLEQGHVLDSVNVGRTIDMVKADERPSEVLTAEVLRSARGRAVRPKTSGQACADAIGNNVITSVIGPAGTGKSYLAVALGVQAPGQTGQPHHHHPTGGRSGSLPRPGRPHGQGRPLPPTSPRPLRPIEPEAPSLLERGRSKWRLAL